MSRPALTAHPGKPITEADLDAARGQRLDRSPPARALDLLLTFVNAHPDQAGERFRGQYADPGNPMHFTHDIAALQYYVETKASNPNTQRRYQLELERALLWLWVILDKSFSDCAIDDFRRYQCFLLGEEIKDEDADGETIPIKESYWSGQPVARFKKAAPNPEWRPYKALPLSEDSAKHSLSIIKAFLSWAKDKGYLTVNVLEDMDELGNSAQTHRLANAAPARGFLYNRTTPEAHREEMRPVNEDDELPATDPASTDDDTGAGDSEDPRQIKYIPLAEWESLVDFINERPTDTLSRLRRYHQEKFIILFHYHTAARINEVASHGFGHLRKNDELVWWSVVGKGGKSEIVQARDGLGEIVDEYLAFMEMTFQHARKRNTPLTLSRTARRHIKTRQVYNIIMRVFDDYAKEIGRPFLYSPHSIRHSIITHMLNDFSCTLQETAKFARHSRVEMTMKYYKN